MLKTPTVREVECASLVHLRSVVAVREGARLLHAGHEAAVATLKPVLGADVGRLGIEQVTALVVAKEASDLLGLYDLDPAAYPDGRTADLAIAASAKNAGRRYQRGRCALCKGPALDCARRHARGRSCA